MIKKVVYSHWSKPMGEEFVGFNSEKMFIASAYLSVMLNLNYFEEVELVTDKRGKELFVDKWKIPFTSVVVCLDELNHVNKKHWAIGKLRACAIQDKPFMHQDMDVFWFKRPPSFVFEAEACFQNFESDVKKYPFYGDSMHRADSFFEKKKPFVDYKKLCAVNCGIMAFNNLSVIQEWHDHAFEYIEYHDTLSEYDDLFGNISSLMFEQFHLYYFLKNADIDVSTLQGGEPSEGQFISEERASELGYTHLISSSKRNKRTEELVLDRLGKTSPEFYKKLVLTP